MLIMTIYLYMRSVWLYAWNSKCILYIRQWNSKPTTKIHQILFSKNKQVYNVKLWIFLNLPPPPLFPPSQKKDKLSKILHQYQTICITNKQTNTFGYDTRQPLTRFLTRNRIKSTLNTIVSFTVTINILLPDTIRHIFVST